jgi:PAS domain S-box-containing protein
MMRQIPLRLPAAVRRAGSDLGGPARVYIAAVVVTALAVTVPSMLVLSPESADMLAFLALAAGAAAASVLVVPSGRDHGFHPAIVFVLAAAVLLPPGLVVLVPIAQHLPDLVKRRYPWYIQTFNVANYSVDAFAAWAVVHALNRLVPGSADLRLALAGSAACVVYVVANHTLLAVALRLARGHSFRESGLFSGHGLWIDIGLAGLGVALAAFWRSNPYLAPALIAPLVLIHRSFSVLADLRASESRFRAIFESTAMGSGLTDLQGTVLETNRSYEELLAYEKHELVGTSHESLTHPDDREQDGRLFAEMVGGQRESYQLEKRFLRKDGKPVWAQLTSSIVRDADGKPRFTIGMVQDVSRRKQLEDELRHAQKMDAVGRLAGGVAHDFNNLLTIIQTYSGFALERATTADPALRRDLTQIVKAGQRATALTRQLLAFSRRQVVQPQVLDLNALVVDTNEMLSRLISSEIEVTARLDPSLGRVKADPDQLSQVLVNLAVNAHDAMPRGGILTIETANIDGLDGRSVSLVVRDTGIGMDAETASHVFEPFFTTKEKGKGTGLGLSTVYGIVSSNGGTISVESEPGRGTAFTMRLPEVAENLAAPVVVAGGEGAPDGRETILVVEDEDAVRTAMRRILRARGYDVLEAFGADDALNVAERHRGPIDLLVTDVVMPVVRGPELVEQLADVRPGVKVLFVSGFTGEADVSGLLVRGHIGFLSKPFTEQALALEVRGLLDGAPRVETG